MKVINCLVLLLCSCLIILYLSGCANTTEFVPHTILSFNDTIAFQSNRTYLNQVDVGSIINANFRNQGSLSYHTFLRDFPELHENGVAYEWWPVIPGSYDPNFPTIQQPDMYYSGIIGYTNLSTEDVSFAHPFGLDFNLDVYPITSSSEYRKLIYNSKDQNHATAWRPLHIEIESGLFPFDEFGFIPRQDDAFITLGSWIIDAGHDPFQTEIHPPSFIAIARRESYKTKSFAFANPFRTTQLYNPDKSLVNNFSDWLRFKHKNTKPFPKHLMDEINKIYGLIPGEGSLRLEAHSLIEPLNPGVISWFVCDTTTNHSQDAVFHCDYHFTKRSGVEISVIQYPQKGYVQIIASIGPDYQPAEITRSEMEWEWQAIDGSAKQNVRHAIYDAAKNPLHVPHPSVEKNPLVDVYRPLRPLSNDNINSIPSITTSDQQPFPFYGWVNVYWTDRVLATRVSSLTGSPEELYFSYTEQITKKTITITNLGDKPITISDNLIEQDNSNSFSLSDTKCKNSTLNQNEICVIEISFDPQTSGALTALLHIRTSDGKNDLYIDLKGDGLIR